MVADAMRHVGTEARNLLQLSQPRITRSIRTGRHVTHLRWHFGKGLQLGTLFDTGSFVQKAP
eukprot:scaffold7167_cov165-Amphora_coffeaeformis.AAC.1